ncbi:MAG: sulfatase-like hydrolase/transferase, partial [Verrucomicrobiota bacterium]|nr:sulfatase-like hydrolase/transferase [Verrucomicrobiota bacterium]
MIRTKQIFRRVVAAGLCVVTSLCPASPSERPNILLITTDDQGMQAGCYGDPLARTPNIDRLAAEGTRFTRGYVTQASCSPSRSSILTGLYPHQNGQIGLTNNYSMNDGIQTLPML